MKHSLRLRHSSRTRGRQKDGAAFPRNTRDRKSRVQPANP